MSNCNFSLLSFAIAQCIPAIASNISVVTVAFPIIRNYSLANCVGVLSVWGRKCVSWMVWQKGSKCINT